MRLTTQTCRLQLAASLEEVGIKGDNWPCLVLRPCDMRRYYFLMQVTQCTTQRPQNDEHFWEWGFPHPAVWQIRAPVPQSEEPAAVAVHSLVSVGLTPVEVKERLQCSLRCRACRLVQCTLRTLWILGIRHARQALPCPGRHNEIWNNSMLFGITAEVCTCSVFMACRSTAGFSLAGLYYMAASPATAIMLGLPERTFALQYKRTRDGRHSGGFECAQ
jgi:hypothetical protein